MRIENYISLTRKFNGTGLFYASGSFGILDGYSEAFAKGGPMAFSCDLGSFSEK